MQVTDPVGVGFVTSLARPGGNVTGFTSSEFSMGGKWIEMLREIDPPVAPGRNHLQSRTAPYAEHFQVQLMLFHCRSELKYFQALFWMLPR